MPSSDSLDRHDIPALVETRLSVLERRIDVDLRLGLHARLVPELRALTTAHPLRERIWGQLMTALYRRGRQADLARTTARPRLGSAYGGFCSGGWRARRDCRQERGSGSIASEAGTRRGRPYLIVG
ncbi:BTAD domain-containing putative transcriptional regulator [Kribbella qitaiheensis]|uniref:BTAD domain-containing putative transcriptional regulator n=1 Tax=Kribbella qitaiheensis TaxID=1544730 RepID=UPI00360E038E